MILPYFTMLLNQIQLICLKKTSLFSTFSFLKILKLSSHSNFPILVCYHDRKHRSDSQRVFIKSSFRKKYSSDFPLNFLNIYNLDCYFDLSSRTLSIDFQIRVAFISIITVIENTFPLFRATKLII